MSTFMRSTRAFPLVARERRVSAIVAVDRHGATGPEVTFAIPKVPMGRSALSPSTWPEDHRREVSAKMQRIEVSRESGVQFRARIGRHELVYDQPAAAGGTDMGPTPTDAFVASLAACDAHYAAGFLVRHGRSADGLRVGAEFMMAEHPSRVGEVAIEISVADSLPGTMADALRAVAEHCTVHNSIALPPDVRIRVASPADRVSAGEVALT